MKIRHQISIWVAVAGVSASLIFSLLIFFAMLDHHYELIDAELDHVGRLLIQRAEAVSDLPSPASTSQFLPHDPFRYWIKVYDQQGQVLLASELASLADFKQPAGPASHTAEREIPRTLIDLNQDEHDGVFFRLRAIPVSYRGGTALVHIGKPIEALEENIIGLGRVIATALLITVLLLVAISYLVAGRILRPVTLITDKIQQINATTLDQRIPMGKSKDELNLLAASLNTMLDRLHDSFLRQKQFIANASHELKNPITLLLLFMEDATQQEELPEPFRKRLLRQADILGRMGRLVKNLLRLSALELQEGLHLEELNLAGLVHSVLDEYEDALVHRRLAVSRHLPDRLPIRGDRDLLHRAMVNLVDNAIKYNHDGGAITVTLTKDAGEVRLVLANSGRAIPPEDIDRVFDQFYRVEKSRSSLHGGAGLGLTIVKKIIELHGGRISLRSSAERGTEVSIHLGATCTDQPTP